MDNVKDVAKKIQGNEKVKNFTCATVKPVANFEEIKKNWDLTKIMIFLGIILLVYGLGDFLFNLDMYHTINIWDKSLFELIGDNDLVEKLFTLLFSKILYLAGIVAGLMYVKTQYKGTHELKNLVLIAVLSFALMTFTQGVIDILLIPNFMDNDLVAIIHSSINSGLTGFSFLVLAGLIRFEFEGKFDAKLIKVTTITIMIATAIRAIFLILT